jgi:hypothetical protein
MNQSEMTDYRRDHRQRNDLTYTNNRVVIQQDQYEPKLFGDAKGGLTNKFVLS